MTYTWKYAQVSDVQKVIWKETIDSFTESRIEFYLDWTTAMIDNIIWDISEIEKTEQISLCDINKLDWSFLVNNINVVSIEKINWVDYVWTLNEDFMIRYWRKLYINNLATYLDARPFNFFDITYTSWFNPIPNDIILLQSLMVAWELANENWKEVTSYKVWDVAVSFANWNSWVSTLKTIISKYTIAIC